MRIEARRRIGDRGAASTPRGSSRARAAAHAAIRGCVPAVNRVPTSDVGRALPRSARISRAMILGAVLSIAVDANRGVVLRAGRVAQARAHRIADAEPLRKLQEPRAERAKDARRAVGRPVVDHEADRSPDDARRARRAPTARFDASLKAGMMISARRPLSTSAREARPSASVRAATTRGCMLCAGLGWAPTHPSDRPRHDRGHPRQIAKEVERCEEPRRAIA